MSSKVKSIKDLDKVVIKNLPVTEQQKSILQRRVNKLKKDPKGFLEGSLQKRSKQIREHIPIKYSGSNYFTVISAVYNVEKYLDDYFSSLMHQSLSFKKHIKLILVDDGSTDESAYIIKKWQKKYPKNITYLYKENGGQASARNVGLEHVESGWITFIDPDDFVSYDYFYKLDKFIERDSNIAIISCPLLPFIENEGVAKNNHPLKFRYKDGDKIKPINSIGRDLQLSASTAIFRADKVKGLKFNETIKPSFEDAKFVLDFLLRSNDLKIGYIHDIKYFYRKREDGTSTLDTAWDNKGLFSVVLKDGVLASLKSANLRLGYIPKAFQNTALYHLYWYFGRIINNSYSLNHLTNNEQKEFYELVKEIFSFIDSKTIEEFNLAGAWFFHKVGFLNLLKNQEPSFQIVYVEKYDVVKNQVLLSFFSSKNAVVSFLLDKKDTIPAFYKEIDYNFMDHNFVTEHRFWLDCNNAEYLSIKVKDRPARISYRGKHLQTLSIDSIKEDYIRKTKGLNNTWLFIDRNNQADDNAEHLYRYIKDNELKDDIFFALNRDSHDWERLSNEGFKLVAFGSPEFENILITCNKIISSHVDGYITHYFKDNSLMDKDFIFLQHGVTKDDLSSWLNSKKNISKFITVTSDEYNSICGDGSPYKFTKKEVALTGFPRYDSLMAGNSLTSKNILVMPTWRNNIVGKIISGNQREYNPNFMQTEYAKHWHSFINSDFVKSLVHNHGFQVTFVPHPNIQEYMDVFTLPDHVDVWEYRFGNIQALFQKALCLVTDYSSVAFDIAYLNKLVFYYQFDAEQVFNGSHTYRKGYFTYENHGFGPVSQSEEVLIDNINDLLIKKNKEKHETYLNRISNTFAYRDSNNCERVYKEILQLDNKQEDDIGLYILASFTERAKEEGLWDLLEYRSKEMLELLTDTNSSQTLLKFNKYQYYYIYSLYRLGSYEKLLQYLSENSVDNSEYWYAKIKLRTGFEEDAIQYLRKSKVKESLDEQLYLLLIISIKFNDDLGFAESLKASISENELDEARSKIFHLANDFANHSFSDFVLKVDSILNILTVSEKRFFNLELFACYTCLYNDDYSLAHEYLVKYEKHSVANIECRILIIRLADLQDNFNKVIDQYEKVFGSSYLSAPSSIKLSYIRALVHKFQWDQASQLIKLENHSNIDNSELLGYYLEVLVAKQEWSELQQLIESKPMLEEKYYYEHTLALYRQGLFHGLDSKSPTPSHTDSYEYTQLISEIAEVNNNVELLEYCVKNMIARFPDRDKQNNLKKLRGLRRPE